MQQNLFQQGHLQQHKHTSGNNIFNKTELKNRKKSINLRAGSLRKINQPGLLRKKRQKAQINKIRNETGKVRINTTEIQNIITNDYEKL